MSSSLSYNQSSFPELMKFSEQLKFIEKAAGVQWDSVLSGFKELELGFQKVQKERELKGQDCPAPLNKFVQENEEKMQQLAEQCKLATSWAEFYGENLKTMQPVDFFTKLTQFIQNFKRCKQENDNRIQQERRQKEEAERRSRTSKRSDIQSEMLQELAEKMGGAKRQRLKIDSQQINHGDLEKIMAGLKQSYPAEGGMPTPQRRTIRSSSFPAPRAVVPPPVAPKTRIIAVDRN